VSDRQVDELREFLEIVPSAKPRYILEVWGAPMRDAFDKGFVEIALNGIVQLTDSGRAFTATSDRPHALGQSTQG
jgi:hypothetical protein